MLQMGDLYSSVIGTTVLQLKELPDRPTMYNGAVCLFALHDGVDEPTCRAALAEFGEIAGYKVGSWPPVVVHFTTHEAAIRAAQAGARLKHIADGIDTWFNERGYDGRGW